MSAKRLSHWRRSCLVMNWGNLSQSRGTGWVGSARLIAASFIPSQQKRLAGMPWKGSSATADMEAVWIIWLSRTTSSICQVKTSVTETNTKSVLCFLSPSPFKTYLLLLLKIHLHPTKRGGNEPSEAVVKKEKKSRGNEKFKSFFYKKCIQLTNSFFPPFLTQSLTMEK